MASADVGNEFQPSLPIPPGATLSAELRARKISQGTFANWIGRDEHGLKRIIRGDDPVTPDLAQNLERSLDIPASFWLNYEKAYRAGLEKTLVSEANGSPLSMRVACSRTGMRPSRYLHFSLLEIGRIPESVRGVYAFWHKDSGTCVYVGKAEDQPLKERLKQHWRNPHNKTLALWLRGCGDRIMVSYIPIREFDKIPQAEKDLIRLWQPVANC